ncbi:CPCC family cysteine-rich protein [Kitasatospora sp. NPDC054939]
MLARPCAPRTRRTARPSGRHRPGPAATGTGGGRRSAARVLPDRPVRRRADRPRPLTRASGFRPSTCTETRSREEGAAGETVPVDTRRPCPCCGHLVLDAADGWPGSYSICPICAWEDDPVPFRWPFMPRGADRLSLVEAQQNYRAYGACDQRGRRFVRPPLEDEPVDPEWRPIDPADVFAFEEWRSETPRPWPDDRSVLCWWLPTFWGAPEDPEPDPDRRVEIDLGSVLSERELHEVLKRDLGFPWFYGMNWNAFWDAVTGLVVMPRELCFVHWSTFEARVPDAAAALRHQLTKYGESAAGFSVTYAAFEASARGDQRATRES